MSNLISVGNISRREALRDIGLAVILAGVGTSVEPAAGQQVHEQAAEMKGALGGYRRQELTAHEWDTVTRLATLILPADDASGSAVDAGAVEFIDLLCHTNDDLAHIFHGGLGWLDAEVRQRVGTTFVASDAQSQTSLLDEIVAEESRRDSRVGSTGTGDYARFRDYQAWEPGELGPGVEFFGWARKMTVDAFYTSPIGLKDLDYRGAHVYSEYTVPQEAIDYVMKRSPFA
jgi:gluconate 2-dehydrogenase gamma chain